MPPQLHTEPTITDTRFPRHYHAHPFRCHALTSSLTECALGASGIHSKGHLPKAQVGANLTDVTNKAARVRPSPFSLARAAALGLEFSMTLAPPGVAHRWSVVGHTPDGWECTTLFDLPDVDRNEVVVHPAAVDKYTVVIYRAGIEMLMDTMQFGNACSVPAEHEVHGGRLLCLRPVTLPHEPSWTARPADAPPSLGPMELYLRLPDAQVSIIFKKERVLKLATILADILAITEKPVAR